MRAETWVRNFWTVMPYMHMWSTERVGEKCSNRELKRWFEKGSVIVNGNKIAADDEMPIIESLTFHPNGKRKCTIFDMKQEKNNG